MSPRNETTFKGLSLFVVVLCHSSVDRRGVWVKLSFLPWGYWHIHWIPNFFKFQKISLDDKFVLAIAYFCFFKFVDFSKCPSIYKISIIHPGWFISGVGRCALAVHSYSVNHSDHWCVRWEKKCPQHYLLHFCGNEPHWRWAPDPFKAHESQVRHLCLVIPPAPAPGQGGTFKEVRSKEVTLWCEYLLLTDTDCGCCTLDPVAGDCSCNTTRWLFESLSTSRECVFSLFFPSSMRGSSL